MSLSTDSFSNWTQLTQKNNQIEIEVRSCAASCAHITAAKRPSPPQARSSSVGAANPEDSGEPCEKIQLFHFYEIDLHTFVGCCSKAGLVCKGGCGQDGHCARFFADRTECDDAGPQKKAGSKKQDLETTNRRLLKNLKEIELMVGVCLFVSFKHVMELLMPVFSSSTALCCANTAQNSKLQQKLGEEQREAQERLEQVGFVARC